MFLLPNWQPDIEANDWYNWQNSGDMDGIYIEGTVASIFWDIFDGIGTEKGWDRFRNECTWTDSMAWGFEPIFWLLHDYNVEISSMDGFWSLWTTRYPTLSTSMGPLSSIYWNYGIDYDAFAPFGGSIIIDHGNAYSERLVTLTTSCKDWGSGVKFVRFSNDLGNTWGTWQAYGPEYSYYMANPSVGIQYVSAQFKDYNGHLSPVYTDSIILDETPPTGSVVIGYGNPAVTKTPFVTLYLTYYDAGSGVSQVRYSEDGTHFEPWEAPTSTKSWTLDYSITNLKGSRNIYYQVMDNLGHVSEIYYDSITLDISPPTFTVWTDKTDYEIGDTMNVYTRLTNPDVGFSVRATIEFRLPNGNTGILYNEIRRLPAGYDSGTTLWRSDKLPAMRPGDYTWFASIKDPITNALISRSEWTWTIF